MDGSPFCCEGKSFFIINNFFFATPFSMSLVFFLSSEPSDFYLFFNTHLHLIGLVLNGGFTNSYVPFLMRTSYSLCMVSFHSSREVDSSKEVGSKLLDKFNSQSYETSMSSTSPEFELSTSPPYCLEEILVHVFLTSLR
jgi:hypothetical protein